MTEHYAWFGVAEGSLALPENFSSKKPQGPSTGRPKGRPKGAPNKPSKAAVRGGGRGRGEQGSRKRKQSEAAVVGAGSSQELLADLFRLDETEVGCAPVIVLDPDQVHGVVANGGDKGDASANTPPTPNTGAPGTPPEMAARCASMMEEGILPSTTLEQRRRHRRTTGTQYGVPQRVERGP